MLKVTKLSVETFNTARDQGHVIRFMQTTPKRSAYIKYVYERAVSPKKNKTKKPDIITHACTIPHIVRESK